MVCSCTIRVPSHALIDISPTSLCVKVVNSTSLFLGWLAKYHGVLQPTLEHFSNGEYIFQWVLTMLMAGEAGEDDKDKEDGQYSFGTIATHTACASRVTSLLTHIFELPAAATAILEANKAQLNRISSHYSNKVGKVKYTVSNITVGGGMKREREEEQMEEMEDEAANALMELPVVEPSFQLFLELQCEVASALPLGFSMGSLQPSCSEGILVDGEEAFPPIFQKPLPWGTLLLQADPEAFTARLFTEAVDMGHMSILEKLQHSPLSSKLVRKLSQAAQLACLWGTPPIRWCALTRCMLDITLPTNWIQLSDDEQHFMITIKETKRTKLQAEASKEVITIKVPTNTTGGKVLHLWEKVGRPFVLNGREGGTLPFFLGHSGEPLPDQSKLRSQLLPQLMEVCKEGGWSELKVQLAKEVLPQGQYSIRKLYGSIIQKHYTNEEEVMLRVSMMDTSPKMLRRKYSHYPIKPEGMELMEKWGVEEGNPEGEESSDDA